MRSANPSPRVSRIPRSATACGWPTAPFATSRPTRARWPMRPACRRAPSEWAGISRMRSKPRHGSSSRRANSRTSRAASNARRSRRTKATGKWTWPPTGTGRLRVITCCSDIRPMPVTWTLWRRRRTWSTRTTSTGRTRSRPSASPMARSTTSTCASAARKATTAGSACAACPSAMPAARP